MENSNPESPAASPFEDPPVIIGHRGAAGLAPENTLASFRRAVELGVQAVELDVHRCDDTLVVIHDDTLERTTSGRGRVAQTSFAALRTVDAGKGQTVPTLDEVLAIVPETVGVNIELKGAGTAELLARRLRTLPHRPILVSSFDHAALATFKTLAPAWPAAPLFSRWRNDPIGTARSFGSGFINLSLKLATANRLEEIQSAGLKALVYTVNDVNVGRRLIADGAWGLFTDYPDRITRASVSG